ncbi:hypothetical protein PPYR_15005, partial [Photinus pyralis]
MENYDDLDFKQRFRFSKTTVGEMLDLVGENLKRSTLRSMAIPPILQLLIDYTAILCNWIFPTGKTVGDTFNIHKSSVCRIIQNVTHYIALMRPDWIGMSNTAEEQNLAISGFYQIAGFPGVLGAIDCTHIKIQSPGGEYAERFRNRKGYFSVNVQAVCNAKLKIQNIIARWPGSVHDSTIFNDSALKVDFESGLYGNGYLLGDNGYPCKRYILTPYLNPASPSQRAYNRAQIATRNPVERLFGVIKRRFPCLSIGFRCRLERALAIV